MRILNSLILILVLQLTFSLNLLAFTKTYVDPFGQYTIYTGSDDNVFENITISKDDLLSSAVTTNSLAIQTFESYFDTFDGEIAGFKVTVTNIIDFYDSFENLANMNIISDFESTTYSNYSSEFQVMSGLNYIVLNHDANTETVISNGVNKVGEIFNAFYWYEDDIYLQFGLVDGSTLASYDINQDTSTGEVTINSFSYPFKYIVGNYEFCGVYSDSNYDDTLKTVTADTYDCDTNASLDVQIILDLTTGSYTSN